MKLSGVFSVGEKELIVTAIATLTRASISSVCTVLRSCSTRGMAPVPQFAQFASAIRPVKMQATFRVLISILLAFRRRPFNYTYDRMLGHTCKAWNRLR